MKVNKNTTLKEFLEDMLGHALNSESNSEAFEGVTVWQYASHIREGGPLPDGWNDGVLSVARSAGPSLQRAGQALVKRYGSAPRPDWLKDRAAANGDDSAMLTEAYRALTGESEDLMSSDHLAEAYDSLFI